MSDRTEIALSVLTAHAKDLRRQNATNSSGATILATRSQSQLPANRDNQSVSPIRTQGAVQPQTHVRTAGNAASRTPDQRQPEPSRGRAYGQTSQEDQEQTGPFLRSWKFLVRWDCGPVGATIGIVGFVSTTLLACYGLKLAIWTATKDYIEHCQADLNIGLISEACQNAAHQQLPPPPPFYGFQNLSSSTIFKRKPLNGMLLMTNRPHLHNNNYVLMYATLANLLCWVVLYYLWNRVARSRSADRPDIEMPFFPLETPEETQARRIDQWLRNEDMPGPRQRIKRQGPADSESNSNGKLGGTWQERLEEMCRMTHIHPPVFTIQSDRRGGRTAWSSSVMVGGQNISARYWYDGQHINNSKEDAAEMALSHLVGVKMDH
ncbi:hypothetical protein V8E51_010945 [Hyaloscypha variabilis]